MNDLETDRLLLRLVPLAGLAATAAKDRETCRRLIGVKLPEAWFDDSWVAELRLNQWKADPGYAPWSIRAIALKFTGEIIGNINCHDIPHVMEHQGTSGLVVEMGYTVFDPWRRQGIAFEAITGLLAFAKSHGVRWARLSISPSNEASLALARKMGANKIGSQIDEIDGPEDIYLLDF